MTTVDETFAALQLYQDEVFDASSEYRQFTDTAAMQAAGIAQPTEGNEWRCDVQWTHDAAQTIGYALVGTKDTGEILVRAYGTGAISHDWRVDD